MRRYTAARFSQDSGVSKDLATKLLDLLYAQDLSAEDLNSLIWRLREWVMKEKLPKILEEMAEEDLKAVINQMIVERAMYRAPYDICCAETPEALSAALAREEHPDTMRFFSEMAFADKELKAGDVVTIQIMRAGSWQHSLYGEVKVTRQTLKDVKQNFDDNKRGIELAVDENHEDNHAALGWHRELFFEAGDEDNLFAKVELTQAGADKINAGSYKYYSPEIAFQWTHEETGETISNILIGGAFTNRPFFKGMKALKASEGASAAGHGSPASGLTLFVFSSPDSMKKYLQLVAKFSTKAKLSKDELAELTTAFNELTEAQKQPEVVKAFNDLKATAEDGAAPADKTDTDKPLTDEEKAAKEAADKAAADADAAASAAADGGEAPVAPAAGETVQANESGLMDGLVFNDDGVPVIEDPAKFTAALKAQQAKLSEAARNLRFSEVTQKLGAFKFSKANPTGILTPALFTEAQSIVMKMSEKEGNALIALIGKFRHIGGEQGSGAKAELDPMAPGYVFTEADEVVKHYMTDMRQPLDKAIASAKAFYEEKRKQAAK